MKYIINLAGVGVSLTEDENGNQTLDLYDTEEEAEAEILDCEANDWWVEPVVQVDGNDWYGKHCGTNFSRMAREQ